MKTYNNIYDRIKTICADHAQINTFGEGDLWELATSGTINYPVFWCVTKNSVIKRGEIGYGFQFVVMDMVAKDETNERDVLSDTLQILTDVLAELKMGEYDGIDIRWSDLTAESFTERFDEEVSGWALDITIWTDFNWNSCTIPT